MKRERKRIVPHQKGPDSIGGIHLLMRDLDKEDKSYTTEPPSINLSYKLNTL